jgi:hypothetical protein
LKRKLPATIQFFDNLGQIFRILLLSDRFGHDPTAPLLGNSSSMRIFYHSFNTSSCIFISAKIKLSRQIDHLRSKIKNRRIFVKQTQGIWDPGATAKFEI